MGPTLWLGRITLRGDLEAIAGDQAAQGQEVGHEQRQHQRQSERAEIAQVADDNHELETRRAHPNQEGSQATVADTERPSRAMAPLVR